MSDDRSFRDLLRTVTINGMVLDQYLSQWANLYNADCVLGIQALLRSLPSACIDFIAFSPPFKSLYVYSASDLDFGNSKGDEFAQQMAFLARELYRILKPGRMMCVHCMDLPMTLTRDGVIGMVDFPGQLTDIYSRAGFIYYGKWTIWKDPEVAEQRTHARDLGHSLMVKDSAMAGGGAADYVLRLRKPGINAVPIAHIIRCEQSSKTVDGGTIIESAAPCPMCGKQTKFDTHWHEHSVSDALATKDERGKPVTWQQYASPLWAPPNGGGDAWATANGFCPDGFVDYEHPRAGNSDKRGIDQGETLNLDRAVKASEKDERHICPMQLDIYRRLYALYTNKCEVILEPFGGIGSGAVVAVEMGRKAVSFELKSAYYRQMVEHVKRVEPGAAGQQTSLLDLLAPKVTKCADCGEDGAVGACGICGGIVS